MTSARPIVHTAAVALAAMLLVGASQTRAGEAPAPRLAPTFASLDELAVALRDALRAADVDRLRRLAVTADEFRDVVWPELDAARPERRLSWDFVWSQHELRHERGLARAAGLFGGQDLVVTAVDFTQETRDYPTFRLHRGSVVRLVTPAGASREAEVFASVIEVDGRFKIYSFITD